MPRNDLQLTNQPTILTISICYAINLTTVASHIFFFSSLSASASTSTYALDITAVFLDARFTVLVTQMDCLCFLLLKLQQLLLNRTEISVWNISEYLKYWNYFISIKITNGGFQRIFQ